MKLNKLKIVMGLVTFLCLITMQSEAYFGSFKHEAMGRTGIAHPLDALSGAINPALNVHVGSRLDLGAAWFHMEGSTKVQGSINPAMNRHFKPFQTKDAYGSSFGFNKQMCDNYTFGIVSYTRAFAKSTFKDPIPIFGTSRLKAELIIATMAGICSYKINDCHSIGVALNVNLLRAKIGGFQTLAQPTLTVYPSRFTNNGYEWTSGFNFVFGWRGVLTPNLAMGITWEPFTSMSNLHQYKGFVPESGNLDLPQVYGFGIEYKISPCITFCYDFRIWEFSNRLAVGNDAQYFQFEREGLVDGAGLGIKNIYFHRFGWEYVLNPCWTFRLGFNLNNGIARRSQLLVMQKWLMFSPRKVLHLGCTWKMDDCNEINFFFDRFFSYHVHGHKSIFESLGGGEWSIKCRIFALGLGWSRKF